MTHAHTYGNTPGYLPDTKPDMLDTFYEAVVATVWDVRGYVTEGGDEANPPRVESAIHGASADGRRWLVIDTTDPSRTHDLGFVYSAEECNRADCEVMS